MVERSYTELPDLDCIKGGNFGRRSVDNDIIDTSPTFNHLRVRK
jgi:hypothetical protein